MKACASRFPVVEIQRTFYESPSDTPSAIGAGAGQRLVVVTQSRMLVEDASNALWLNLGYRNAPAWPAM